jgi:hypothetical protein
LRAFWLLITFLLTLLLVKFASFSFKLTSSLLNYTVHFSKSITASLEAAFIYYHILFLLSTLFYNFLFILLDISLLSGYSFMILAPQLNLCQGVFGQPFQHIVSKLARTCSNLI